MLIGLVVGNCEVHNVNLHARKTHARCLGMLATASAQNAATKIAVLIRGVLETEIAEPVSSLAISWCS